MYLATQPCVGHSNSTSPKIVKIFLAFFFFFVIRTPAQSFIYFCCCWFFVSLCCCCYSCCCCCSCRFAFFYYLFHFLFCWLFYKATTTTAAMAADKAGGGVGVGMAGGGLTWQWRGWSREQGGCQQMEKNLLRLLKTSSCPVVLRLWRFLLGLGNEIGLSSLWFRAGFLGQLCTFLMLP